MFTLVVKQQISAAHRLRGYPGACERIHGHNYRITASVSGNELDQLGMVLDLTRLQTILMDCLGQFDHRIINDVAPFDALNPTSENLARYIFQWLQSRLPGEVEVRSVEVAETDEISVIYSGH